MLELDVEKVELQVINGARMDENIPLFSIDPLKSSYYRREPEFFTRSRSIGKNVNMILTDEHFANLRGIHMLNREIDVEAERVDPAFYSDEWKVKSEPTPYEKLSPLMKSLLSRVVNKDSITDSSFVMIEHRE